MSSKWQNIRWALKGTCPRCGDAPLFKTYLKQVDTCQACEGPWGSIRADDGPAWLTIMLVLHFLIPLFMFMTKIESLSEPFLMGILLLTALVLSLLILPKAKAFFITMIWLTQAGETRDQGKDDKH